VTSIPPRTTAASEYHRLEEERRMSTTIEEVVGHRETLLEVEYDVARRDAEREELAREIEAQHERLHKVRATVLEELTKQRRVTLPRWPSGPKVDASLVDEDEWWSKMLGRKRAA
jgi:cell division FtsZ-interacting protein ZapD